jgi:D-alanine-D-alanine ligase
MIPSSLSSPRLRLGVIMGGKSIEAEVSFNSGRTVCDHLDTHIYDVVPLFQTTTGLIYILPWHFLHRGKIADFEHRLSAEAQQIRWDDLPQLIDFAYIVQHGRYGEDGVLQGVLEVLKIPYLGAKVFGSALGMDKAKQKAWLQGQGIEVPRGFVVTADQILNNDALNILCKSTGLQYPLLVKPAHEGSSRGVAVVKDADEFVDAVYHARTITAGIEQDVLVEEFVAGSEFSCIVLQKNGLWQTLAVTEIVSDGSALFYDYNQKYMPGRARKFTPARFDDAVYQRIMRLCEDVSERICFRTLARIDGIVADDGRIVVIDPNSLAGMSPSTFIFDQAAEHGMSHSQLIHQLIIAECTAYGLPFAAEQKLFDERKIAMQQTQKRIVVLLGGDSNEREVSLDSGRNVCYKLSPHAYHVTPVFVRDDMRLFRLTPALLIKNTTKDIAEKLTDDLEIKWADLPQLADFVFIGLHGGKGENGAVQGMLEMLGLPYNGPGVFASSLCMDKFKANNFLRIQGINVPDGQLISLAEWQDVSVEERESWLAQKIGDIAFPCIVKPHDDGCSVLVSKAHSFTELNTLMALHFQNKKQYVLCEEYIVGMELTVGVIGNKNPHALPPSYSVAVGDILSMEEKFLPGAGENQTPAPLTPEALALVQHEVVRAYQATGCTGYARIDCFYQTAEKSKTGAPRVVILEINTLPALTPATCLFHQAAEIGIKPMELIDEIVRLGFEQHAKAVSLEDAPLQKRATFTA